MDQQVGKLKQTIFLILAIVVAFPLSILAEKQTGPVISFKKFEPLIRLLCSEIDKDGRKVQMYELVTNRLGDYETLAPAKALFKSIIINCQPTIKTKTKVKATKKETEEPPVESTPVAEPQPATHARLPSATVLDTMSRFTVDVYAEERNKPLFTVAINSLCQVLRDPKDKTPGELDYFQTLAEYLAAPWEREALSSSSKPKIDVNSLFEE